MSLKNWIINLFTYWGSGHEVKNCKKFITILFNIIEASVDFKMYENKLWLRSYYFVELFFTNIIFLVSNKSNIAVSGDLTTFYAFLLHLRFKYVYTFKYPKLWAPVKRERDMLEHTPILINFNNLRFFDRYTDIFNFNKKYQKFDYSTQLQVSFEYREHIKSQIIFLNLKDKLPTVLTSIHIANGILKILDNYQDLTEDTFKEFYQKVKPLDIADIRSKRLYELATYYEYLSLLFDIWTEEVKLNADKMFEITLNDLENLALKDSEIHSLKQEQLINIPDSTNTVFSDTNRKIINIESKKQVIEQRKVSRLFVPLSPTEEYDQQKYINEDLYTDEINKILDRFDGYDKQTSYLNKLSYEFDNSYKLYKTCIDTQVLDKFFTLLDFPYLKLINDLNIFFFFKLVFLFIAESTLEQFDQSCVFFSQKRTKMSQWVTLSDLKYIVLARMYCKDFSCYLIENPIFYKNIFITTILSCKFNIWYHSRNIKVSRCLDWLEFTWTYKIFHNIIKFYISQNIPIFTAQMAQLNINRVTSLVPVKTVLSFSTFDFNLQFFINKQFWFIYFLYNKHSIGVDMVQRFVLDLYSCQFIESLNMFDFLDWHIVTAILGSTLQKSRITVSTILPLEHNILLSISNIFSNSVWLEREVLEFNAIQITGIVDKRRLLKNYSSRYVNI